MKCFSGRGGQVTGWVSRILCGMLLSIHKCCGIIGCVGRLEWLVVCGRPKFRRVP